MTVRRFFSLVLVLGICCMAVTGCGKKNLPEDDDVDIVGPGHREDFDRPMGERFDVAGNRVMGQQVQFGEVYFNYDSYQVSDTELGKIEAAAEYLRRNKKHCLITEGNCDERGSREYNLSLGEHRAQAVRAYLIRLGIDGSRIQTKSYGEENPAAAGHAESAWRLNRRVEFAVYSF